MATDWQMIMFLNILNFIVQNCRPGAFPAVTDTVLRQCMSMVPFMDKTVCSKSYRLSFVRKALLRCGFSVGKKASAASIRNTTAVGFMVRTGVHWSSVVRTQTHEYYLMDNLDSLPRKVSVRTKDSSTPN